jgi:curli production assembly/transport component CsgE
MKIVKTFETMNFGFTRRGTFIILLFLAWVYCPGAWGQKDVEIEGLLIDQTRSRIGHEFYEDFVSFWEAPPGAKSFNLVISEQNEPRYGSWVLIEINDNLVYRVMLRPGPEDIAATAQDAIAVVREFLLRWEEFEKSLEGEDMKGKGIY